LRRLETKTRRESRGSTQALACARIVEDLSTQPDPGPGGLGHRRRDSSSVSATVAICVSLPHLSSCLILRASQGGEWERELVGTGLRQGGMAIYMKNQEPRTKTAGAVLSWYHESQPGIASGSARPTKVAVSQSRPRTFRVLSRRLPCPAIRDPGVASRGPVPTRLA
jgi:hypothetical protein